MSTYHFVQPLDVLMIRGNKSFGGDGQHGEAVMPPWPSLFAGAFRSALLGKDAGQLASFAHAGDRLAGDLGAVLGSRDEPGSFAINWLSLAILGAEAGAPQAIVPLPADLVAFDAPRVAPLVSLQPTAPSAGCMASGELPLVAHLRIARQAKPQAGRWLDAAGLAAHLRGELPARTLSSADLFKRETRLGIALDQRLAHGRRRRALYQRSDRPRQPVGFLVGCEGDGGQLPKSGHLRLGGDGKGARYRAIAFTAPVVPRQEIAASRRFRIILATPGVFAGGWLPEGSHAAAPGTTDCKATASRRVSPAPPSRASTPSPAGISPGSSPRPPSAWPRPAACTGSTTSPAMSASLPNGWPAGCGAIILTDNAARKVSTAPGSDFGGEIHA
jgi:CRISPR-associated protein Cmr3